MHKTFVPAEIAPTTAATAHPSGMSRAQLMVVLGVMGFRRNPERPDYGITINSCRAARAFDALLAKAVARGFPKIERRRLIGNLRAGLGTGIAMQRAEAIAALVTEAEFRAELRFIEWLSRGEVSA